MRSRIATFARQRPWGTPILLIVCLVVVLCTAWLTHRQRETVRLIQQRQALLAKIQEHIDQFYTGDNYESRFIVGLKNDVPKGLFARMKATNVEIRSLYQGLGIQPRDFDLVTRVVEEWPRIDARLRTIVATRRGTEDARLFPLEDPELAAAAGRRKLAQLALRNLSGDEIFVLNAAREDRDQQTDLAFTLVVTVVGLLAAVGVAAGRERAKSAAERAERAVREAAERARFQQVIESLGDGFLALDADDRFAFVNPSGSVLLGRPESELIGTRVWDVFPTLVDSELATSLRRAKDQKEPSTYVLTTSTKRTLSLRAHPYQDGLAVHIRDISAERRLEAASRRDQALTEAVVRDVPYGVVVTEEDGTVRRVNAAAKALRGRGPVPGSVGQWFSEDEEGKSIIPFDRLVRLAGLQGASVDEKFLLRSDGTTLEVQLAVTRISDPDGAFGYALVLSDLSDQREARREVESSRDAAIALAKAKSEFLANMSHEIRTPLNGVLGIAEILSRTDLDPEQRAYLTTLRSSGQVLLRVINDVLDISKIEAGKLSISPADTDLPGAIDEFVRLFEGSAREKGLRVAVEGLTALPPRAYVDATRLKQIVGNLLANAIKFSHSGTISIACSAEDRGEGERLRITVSDQGIGIPAERLQSIFDSFSQAEGSHARRYGGTGLGLTISKRLVELMGGTIGVRSAVGVGSTFTVEIPLQRPVLSTDTPVSDSGDGRFSMNVLVAEDNETNVLVARHHLAALGCTTRIVGNGVEALAAMGEEKFDLVLMDVHMPELDGLEATRRWREIERGTGRVLPIFALTASALSEDVSTCLRAGMNGVLHKPYTRAELMATLNQARPPYTGEPGDEPKPDDRPTGPHFAESS